jgi:hypothetical protein
MKLGKLVAENHGLDVDKKLHPRLLLLTECFVTYSRVLLTCSPWSSPEIAVLA